MEGLRSTNKKDRNGRTIYEGHRIECLIYRNKDSEVVTDKKVLEVVFDGPEKGFFPFNRYPIKLKTTEIVS